MSVELLDAAIAKLEGHAATADDYTRRLNYYVGAKSAHADLYRVLVGTIPAQLTILTATRNRIVTKLEHGAGSAVWSVERNGVELARAILGADQ